MNYIGSKVSLLGEIRSMLMKHNVDTGGVFCDVFSGTSVVAQMAKEMGFTVISNDIQSYSYAIQRAFIRMNGYPEFIQLRCAFPHIDQQDISKLETSLFGVAAARDEIHHNGKHLLRVLSYLQGILPQDGPFVDAYCDGGSAGRKYYSRHNGMACQAIRDTIELWRRDQLVDEDEYYILLTSLIESMDSVANTASVYGAYLKKLKKSALQPLRLKAPLLLNGSKPHRVFRRDANELVQELAREDEYEVLYIDPPYNRRQYSGNYHLLETISEWDVERFSPVGKTGLRPSAQRSAYAMQRSAKLPCVT